MNENHKEGQGVDDGHLWLCALSDQLTEQRYRGRDTNIKNDISLPVTRGVSPVNANSIGSVLLREVK